MAAAAKKTPKAPSDRKAKASELEAEIKKDPTKTPGWHLMKPIDDIPVWEQTPLIQYMQSAMETSVEEVSNEEYANMSEEEREVYNAEVEKKGIKKSFDINMLGQLVKELRNYAIDEAEYTKFVSGAGALERGMRLAMAWVGQMGESESSSNS